MTLWGAWVGITLLRKKAPPRDIIRPRKRLFLPPLPSLPDRLLHMKARCLRFPDPTLNDELVIRAKRLGISVEELLRRYARKGLDLDDLADQRRRRRNRRK